MATTMPRPLPLTDPADILLADVAIRVQLSRTNYHRAVDRYQAINGWIEHNGSPLKDRVELFYPQGSMAVGATIASKLGTDEFDIDVVAQLDLPADMLPKQVLDLLYRTIKGAPGSRYHRMTERKSRCVTVQYGGEMHLDVTPVVRRRGTPERESLIFHHRPETPYEPGYTLVANPYGFAEWFKRSTPPDDAFADIFEAQARAYDLQVLAEAVSDPVPPQEPPFRKSKAVIVLQLLKRWRNVQYDARSGRRPPSIMIAKLVADAANCTDRLSEELLLQARHMLSVFQEAHRDRRLVRVVNPVCSQDVLTDRWPESRQDQTTFIRDLDVLVANVERLVSGCDLEEMQQIMTRLFGEKPTGGAFTAFNKRMGAEVRDGRSRHRPGLGGLVIPGVATGIGIEASSVSRATPSHRFFGGERHR